MRTYTLAEVTTLSKYFNDFLLKYDDFKNVVLSSPLTSKDLCRKRTMRFVDFKEKYKLNFSGYYDDYLSLYEKGESIRPDEIITDINLTTKEEMRYPLIILCNNNEKKDNVPEMIHLTELVYTLEHFKDLDMRVIVVDKMIKPLSRELLDKFAKSLNIDYYEYSSYI